MNFTDAWKSALSTTWLGHKSKDKLEQIGWHLCRHFGRTRPVRDLSLRDVQAFVADCSACGQGPATINRKLSVLRELLRQATNAPGCGVLDPSLIKSLREPQARERVLSEGEEQELMQAAAVESGSSFASLLRFLLDTGCRIDEALRVRYGDCHGLAGLKTAKVTFATTKGRRPRTVLLTQRAREACAVGDGTGPFWNWTYSRAYKAWRKAKAATSFRDDTEVTIHTLRHTCATRLAEAGVPLPTIRTWMGHSDIKTTMRYLHLAGESGMDKALAALSA